jgi:hypothetical protein
LAKQIPTETNITITNRLTMTRFPANTNATEEAVFRCNAITRRNAGWQWKLRINNMASPNFSRNGPMSSHIRANGNATTRAPTRADAEDETAVDPEELTPASTETLISGQRKPIRPEPSMELIQGSSSFEPTHDPMLTPEQVAERLHVSPDWVRDHSSRKTPRLPVIRLGGGPSRAGLLRYRASDIERFIEEMARLSERRARAV